jgi:purine-binding chemotaxis protein CheW
MGDTRQFCTFRVDALHAGVEVQHVQEVVRSKTLTVVPLAPRSVHGLMNLRGEILTAIDVRCRLGLPGRPAGCLPMSIVLAREFGTVSLLVDEVGDVLDLDADLFEPPPETLHDAGDGIVVGAYKLRHGLLLVLDVERTVRVGGFAGDGTTRTVPAVEAR